MMAERHCNALQTSGEPAEFASRYLAGIGKPVGGSPVGTSLLAAVSFAAGHLVSEFVILHYAAANLKHRAWTSSGVVESRIKFAGNFFIEFEWAIAAAVIVFVLQELYRRRDAIPVPHRARLCTRALLIGFLYCVTRWIKWAVLQRLHMSQSESNSFALSMILAAVAGTYLAIWRRRFGAKASASLN